MLVVDFDDTLTQGDTVGILIDAAITAQARDVADPDDHRERLSGLQVRTPPRALKRSNECLFVSHIGSVQESICLARGRTVGVRLDKCEYADFNNAQSVCTRAAIARCLTFI